MSFWRRRQESDAVEHRSALEHRSAVEIYLQGGGDPANERTMAILAEADRSEFGNDRGPLHAYELTPADAAVMRMMAGATFAADARLTLPSGRTISGTEMQRWLEAES